jgi:hypothetical protein
MRLRIRFLVVPAVTAALLASLGGCSSTSPPAPEGAWPNICCRTAGDMLDEIEKLAGAAKPGAAPEVLPHIERALERVVKCRTNNLPCPLPDHDHCARVEAALSAARRGDWLVCANELDHGH